ncbi:MAG: hypothetical protein LC130_25585 [Bryobacterales bacterium]|nr:hypothetical protein [Bryobacterales bacterium]
MDLAYYNTTGVQVGSKVRNRPRVYGHARFNAAGGFRPDCAYQMMNKVFDCEPPSFWDGHHKVLFKALLRRPAKPDAYLVVTTEEQSGGVDKRHDGKWLDDVSQLISFSECSDRQEIMVVMPPYGWLCGRLGTFFLEPERGRPWQARLILSSSI